MKNNPPRVHSGFSLEELESYPGLFEIGSREDDWIKSMRAQSGSDDEKGTTALLGGDLINFGFVSEKYNPPESKAIPSIWIENDRIGNHFDMHTLIEIDWRLRYCRCLLDFLGCPYDRGNVFYNPRTGQWYYESDGDRREGFHGPSDPLDFLLRANFALSREWYAAKILAHARRSDFIVREPGQAIAPEHRFSFEIAMMREWMLFGETWAEAKFVINHSDVAIAKLKQNDANRLNGQKGGQAAAKRQRYETLNGLALNELVTFVGLSDREKIARAMRLARDYDVRQRRQGLDEIFVMRGKALNRDWYEEWLEEFRPLLKEKLFQEVKGK